MHCEAVAMDIVGQVSVASLPQSSVKLIELDCEVCKL